MSAPAKALPPRATAGSPQRAQWRWLLTPVIAVLIVWLLLVLMRWMIRAPEGQGNQQDDAPAVEMVRVQPRQDQPQDQSLPAAAAPPPPPAAPPSLSRPSLPSISAPAIAISAPTVDVANVGTPISLGSGEGLSGSGAFGGFAGNGSGSGSGSGGGGGGGAGGQGEGFKGKELVPLSTARPQMPEWACKQKIAGWVEVVFTVMPNGRVQNVKIVDAQPRGVYEGPAIDSVSNWIYPQTKVAQEVKQRVEMDPADCAFNWR